MDPISIIIDATNMKRRRIELIGQNLKEKNKILIENLDEVLGEIHNEYTDIGQRREAIEKEKADMKEELHKQEAAMVSQHCERLLKFEKKLEEQKTIEQRTRMETDEDKRNTAALIEEHKLAGGKIKRSSEEFVANYTKFMEQMMKICEDKLDLATTELKRKEQEMTNKLLVKNREWAVLLFDVLRDLYPRQGCVLFLESMMKVSPSVNEEMKKEAMTLAEEWIKELGGNHSKIQAFLLLVAAFDLSSCFDPEELYTFVKDIYEYGKAVQLIHSLNLTDRVFDFKVTKVVKNLLKHAADEGQSLNHCTVVLHKVVEKVKGSVNITNMTEEQMDHFLSRDTPNLDRVVKDYLKFFAFQDLKQSKASKA